jgi:hypothetical protein
MTWSVYQNWDALQVCIVGRCYPPEFYSWITTPRARDLFEKIAYETEQDFQVLIKKLQSFGVEVLRPELPAQPLVDGKYVKPPISPADYTAMIGDTFYYNDHYVYPSNIKEMYADVKDVGWPECKTWTEFEVLPKHIKDECLITHGFDQYRHNILPLHLEGCYDHILNRIRAQGNQIKYNFHTLVSTAQVNRIGKDLYFGTDLYERNFVEYQQMLDCEFPKHQSHIVGTRGHSDAVYCVICPGLIITTSHMPDVGKHFPGWEVITILPSTEIDYAQYKQLKLNHRHWWVPGFEHDDSIVNFVEQNLAHWTGDIEETIFDVNMLIVDEKNVLMFSHNQQIEKVLQRYGITAHIVPFRHRYFWDNGIHCVTSDLHRASRNQNTKQEIL